PRTGAAWRLQQPGTRAPPDQPPAPPLSGFRPRSQYGETATTVSKRDRHAAEEAVAGDDLVHYLGRRRGGGRDDHRRQAAVAAGILLGLAADRGRDDVDPVVAERVANPAEHAGQVPVAKQGHRVLELDIETLTPRLDQVRAVASAEQGSGDADCAPS